MGIDLKVFVAVFIQNDHGHNITCHRESYAMGLLKKLFFRESYCVSLLANYLY